MDYIPSLEEREKHWVKFLEIGTTDSVLRQLLAREIFETSFNIHNHDVIDVTDPFPLATIKRKRARDWAKKAMIDRIIDAGITEKTGMSIHDLLYQTNVQDFEDIMEKCEKVLKRENDLAKEVSSGHDKDVQNALNAINHGKKDTPMP